MDSDERSMVRRLRTAVVLAAAAVLLAGCSSSSTTASSGTTAARAATPATSAPAAAAPANVPVVTIKVHEDSSTYTFDAPAAIDAGWVELDLVNSGALAHQAGIGAVPAGADIASYEAAVTTDPVTLTGTLDEAGGPNSIAAGQTQKVILNLKPGTYFLYCMVPDPVDDKPHVAHGMVKELTVRAPAGGSTPVAGAGGGDPVAVAGTIDMRDYTFVMPEPFTGKGWYKVTNAGPQPHELTVIALKDGKTANEVKAFFADTAGGGLGVATNPATPKQPRPYVDEGGLGSIDVGGVGYAYFDLPKGDYVAMCYVPDAPAAGRQGTADLTPHFMHGMWQPFTIS